MSRWPPRPNRDPARGSALPRAALAPSPDVVANPSLVVAVGALGHEVALRLEQHAAGIADVDGPDTTRNLAVLRILTRDEVQEARAAGLELGGPGLHFAADEAALRHAFASPAVPVVAGLDPARPPERASAEDLLVRLLRHAIATLFRVDRFVDFHPDDDSFASRLDVYVVGRVDHPLAEQAHAAVLRALGRATAGPLAPLFPDHRSNLALLHLLAVPLVSGDADETRRRAKALVVRCRADLEAVPRPLPCRFLFLEDRSAKYVLSREQLASPLVLLLRFLLLGRAGTGSALRHLVQDIPDAQRLRDPRAASNRLCGSFSIALFGAATHRLLAYCRNRQAIAMLNVFLDRPQDGEPPAPADRRPFAETKAFVDVYGEEGRLERGLEACTREVVTKLEADRRRLEDAERVRDWGLGDIGEWEYHGDLVEAYHDDLEGRGQPRYTLDWVGRGGARVVRFLDRFVTRAIPPVFAAVDRGGDELVRQFAAEERRRTDELIASAPAGWKQALDLLECALREIDRRIAVQSEKTIGVQLRPISREVVAGLLRARIVPVVESFRDDVDDKPVRGRLLRTARSLGIAAGAGAGTLASLAVPLTLLGLGVVVLPAGVAGWFAGEWLARRYNRRILERLGAAVSASPTCSLRLAIDAVCDALFRIDDPGSFLGERVAWSLDLWRLRLLRRLHAELSADVDLLRDIGRALEAQLAMFRRAQEGLGVRYWGEAGVLREDATGVLPEGDAFQPPMFSAALLDDLYREWARPPAATARDYIATEKPFEDWRRRLPFADHREIGRFCRRPFEKLREADLFELPVTRDEANARLLSFLGDFAHKLELHASRTGGEARETDAVAFHGASRARVGGALQALRWPTHWTALPELSERNCVWLVRYLQDLAPWGLEALPDRREMVDKLIDERRYDALRAVLAAVDAPQERIAMLAAALPRLAREQPRLCAELLRRPAPPGAAAGGTEEPDEAPPEPAWAWEPLRPDRDRPIDGARFAPADRAEPWLDALAGTPGLLPFAVLLYGTALDPTPDPLLESQRRAVLLVRAAEGRPEWAWQALAALPQDWRNRWVLSYLTAATVLDLILQGRTDDALRTVDRVEPPALRAATLLRAAADLLARGSRQEAERFVDAAPAPGEGPWDRPDPLRPIAFAEARELVAALPGRTKLAALLAWVYGGRPRGAPGAVDRRELAAALLDTAVDEAQRGAVLGTVLEFPGEAVDPRLVAAVRELVRQREEGRC